MKPTIEGSNAVKFDMLGMSFGKEKQKGLKVVHGATKSSVFNEDMTIIAENSELRENNTLKTASGNIISFKEKAFETVKENRNARKTKVRRASKADREII